MYTVGIIGKNGQLGNALFRRSPKGDVVIKAFGRSECDVTDADSVEQGLTPRPMKLDELFWPSTLDQ